MPAFRHRILVKNGHIYDPGKNIDKIGDIAMYKNRIVEEMPDDKTPIMVIDAQGDMVVPGLIDFHVHIGYGCTEGGLAPDISFLPNGVTTVVDGGSRGTSNFRQMAIEIVPSSFTTVKCLLNFSPTGLVTEEFAECIDPKFFDYELMQYFFEQYPDELVGLKLRLMKSTLPDYQNTGLAPLEQAVKIADKLGTYICVHVTELPCPYADILDLMRPGDVLVHPYQQKGEYTIIDDDGNVDEAVFRAKKRGVLFDLAGSRSNQSYGVAKQAIAQGFIPDFFSTDLMSENIYMTPAFSLPYILSTYKNMGVSTEELIKGCTATPAKKLGMKGKIGTLAPGAFADICILKEKDFELEYKDRYGNSFMGSTFFEPQLTIKNGRIAYMNMEVKQDFIRP